MSATNQLSENDDVNVLYFRWSSSNNVI